MMISWMYFCCFGLEDVWWVWIADYLVPKGMKLDKYFRSLLQYLSAVGYCVFPLAIIGFLVSVLHSVLPSFVKIIILIVALLWSIVSCLIVMRDIVAEEKKWLCAYPIFLFYLFMAWYAIVVWRRCNDYLLDYILSFFLSIFYLFLYSNIFFEEYKSFYRKNA